MLLLRRATENDVDQLVKIKRAAFKDEFEKYGFVPEDMISVDWHKNMLKKSIYYTIIYSKKVIGGVNIFEGKEGCYLCSLFIDKHLQNQGIGTEVIKTLERLHSRSKKWQLETPTKSKQNHHFYEKCGYTYIKDITPEDAPKGFSLRLYEK